MKPLREKHEYTKPAMQVFELQHSTKLLTGSGTNGSRNPYGDPTNWNWD